MLPLLIRVLLFLLEIQTVVLDSAGAVENRDVACYDKLGCFSTDPPFTSIYRPLSMVPDSPDTILTTFYLYTRETATSAETLDGRFPETLGTTWRHLKARPSQFIVHGFINDPSLSPWLRELKDELLIHDDYNVVIVDWSHGNLPPYNQAAANARVVGAQIANVIYSLMNATGISPGDIHLIGHSLGCHVTGYAGERVPGLGRITGLDPAGPAFEDTDKVVRLDLTDAIFVDVIHSDALNLLQLGQGMKQLVGHVDFFPNLGHDQPGCTRDPVINILENGLIEGIEETVSCSHMRSIKFFTESINSQCPFLGFPCVSEEDFQNNLCHSCTSSGCAKMGFYSNQHIPPDGEQMTYYLTTAANTPFCQYHLDLKLKLTYGTGTEEKGTMDVVINGDQGSSSMISLASVSDPVTFTPGHTYNYYLMVPSDIGSVQSVTLSWSHVFSITDPLHWNILGLRHPTLYLEEVDVYREEAGDDVSDPVTFTPGHTYNYYLMVPSDIGSVQSVTLSWSHVFSITDPLHWNILGLRHPTLYLDEVDVYREEAGDEKGGPTNVIYNTPGTSADGQQIIVQIS